MRPVPVGERAAERHAVAAAAASATLLLVVYVATLAPGVTLWDAGELISAVHGLGIPHPPGTPLFVAIGRAWTALLPGVPTAAAANLLSAVSVAGACGLVALLLARWTRHPLAAFAGGATAGLMTSVWRNATETEVYALALLLAALALVAADRAGRREDRRAVVLVAYLFALAAPLHLFALVAAPAAILLAATGDDGAPRWDVLALLAGAFAIAAGVGTVRPTVAAAGGALVLLAPLVGRRWPQRRVVQAADAALVVVVVAVAASALAILRVRAGFDPALNQGDPSSLAALADVVARRQYAVAPVWPRQAPLWLQLGNVLEWADWQVALGLAPEPPPTVARTGLTLAFAALGAYGAAEHRRADRRGWRALLVLLVASSLGVALYLNLRTGPSFGAGVLPDGAPREARERDYFYAFAFWTWGLWAGYGAVRLAARVRPVLAPVGVAAALLPLVLNWRAVDRRRGPDATIARDAARALLLPAPPRAVLLSAGDNDTYPLWYLQQVEGARPDVTVIVTALLPAAWYRAELERRTGLGAAASAGPWRGGAATLGAIVRDARARGRPVLASTLLSGATRERAAAGWALRGPWYELGGRRGGPHDPGTAAAAALARRQVSGAGVPVPSADPATRAMRRLLSCAALLQQPPADAATQLADRCSRP